MRIVSLLFHDVYLDDPSESGFRSPHADRYKLPATEFAAQMAGLAGACPRKPLLAVDLANQPWRDGLAFTVDDGGVSYHSLVADRLEALDWRGHCFISTDFIGRPGFLDRRQLRELDARGHVIGSHSASHPTRFSASSAEHMSVEWTRSRKALEDLLGHAVTVASVPGGYCSTGVARAAGDAGFQCLFTSEPETRLRRIKGSGIVLAGRFTVRRGCRPDLARALVLPAPWARSRAWVGWNARGLVKPLLGSAYPRLADWLLTRSNPRPVRSVRS
jgi:peptidoglycan/xylan/chitin deacetylase (PgdA/CDA1 family)